MRRDFVAPISGKGGGVDSLSILNISVFGDFAKEPVPGVQFARLAAASHALPHPPRFIFGPLPADMMVNYFSHWGLSSVGVYTLGGFELSGVFLLSANDTYYRCPELNVHQAHIEFEVQRIAVGLQSSQRRHLPGSYVVLAGPGHAIYGHWLAEYLPKLALLHFAGFDLASMRFLVPVGAPNFVLSWLSILGIRDDQIIRHDPMSEVISADNLILPTIMHNGVRMSPLFRDACRFLRQLIERDNDLRGSTLGSRVFLARPPNSTSRALTNRPEIEAAAGRAGFAIVYPERLSLLEQLRLFAESRAIIGEYGSALHGSMFAQEDAVVCALRGPFRHPGFMQSGIGSAIGQPTGYIFGEADDNEVAFGFRVQTALFENAIRLVFDTGLLV